MKKTNKLVAQKNAPETKNDAVVKTETAGVNKPEIIQNARESDLNGVLKEIEKMERIKCYYAKFKVKALELKKAIAEIEKFKESNLNPLVEKTEDFPYVIILQKEGESFRDSGKIFTINQVDTVLNFVNHLDSEMDLLIKNFEDELVYYRKRLDHSKM